MVDELGTRYLETFQRLSMPISERSFFSIAHIYTQIINTQMHKYKSTQLHKVTNTQKDECPNAQIETEQPDTQL